LGLRVLGETTGATGGSSGAGASLSRSPSLPPVGRSLPSNTRLMLLLPLKMTELVNPPPPGSGLLMIRFTLPLLLVISVLCQHLPLRFASRKD